MITLPRFDYDSVVFDCDGIILRSNTIKSDAFAEALPDEPPELTAAFVAWHQERGGVSRFAKFEHYFTVMAPRKDAKSHIDAAIRRYGEIVEKKLMSCATGPGLIELLTLLNARNITCSVNSGGSEAELHIVFTARGLDRHFKMICGSPTTKFKNMHRLREAGLLSGHGLMIGDSRSDYLAAKENGLDFAFVTLDSEWEGGVAEMTEAQPHGGVFIFNDLTQISRWATTAAQDV